MKNSARKLQVLPILSTLYWLLYVFAFIIPLFSESIVWDFEAFSVLGMFLLFTAAAILSWFEPKWSGFLMQAWFLLIVTLSLYFWPDAGMVIILGYPVMVLGVFLHFKAYKREAFHSSLIKWKFVLQTFMINYTLIQLIINLPELLRDDNPDYFVMPLILFPILFVIFISAYIISFRSALFGGVALLAWYAVVVFATFSYPGFANEGPAILFGFPIFVQGVLYIIGYFKFERKVLEPN